MVKLDLVKMKCVATSIHITVRCTSDAFKGSKYYPVYLKLTSTEIFSKLISNFQIPSNKDLNFDYSTLTNVSSSLRIQKANAATISESSLTIKQVKIVFNSDVFLETISPVFAIGSDGSVIKETIKTVYGRSEIAMARTMLHEAIHAKLKSEGVIENHHNLMATSEYRSLIKDGLKQFAVLSGLEYSDEDLEILSFGGLHESDTFKALPEDRQEEILFRLKELEKTVEFIDIDLEDENTNPEQNDNE